MMNYFLSYYKFKDTTNMNTMKLTYSIQVCNESRELFSLLNFLLKVKDSEDEINVIVDSLHTTDKVKLVLKEFDKQINVYPRAFDNFCDNSNYHLDMAKGDYIVGLDADEMPQEKFVKGIKQILNDNDIDILFIPRINIHPGLTQQFLNDSKFNVNECGWINWPDFQGRISRNIPSIRWSNELHTKLSGSTKVSGLPAKPELALWHIKSIEKQESRWKKQINKDHAFASPSETNLYDLLM